MSKKTTAELAIYFHDQIVKNFKEDPKHRFTVIESAANQTSPALQLELALIKIDPSASVFEARLREKKSWLHLQTETCKMMPPIDLTRLTWYGPAKTIMDRWTQQFVEIAN